MLFNISFVFKSLHSCLFLSRRDQAKVIVSIYSLEVKKTIVCWVRPSMFRLVREPANGKLGFWVISEWVHRNILRKRPGDNSLKVSEPASSAGCTEQYFPITVCSVRHTALGVNARSLQPGLMSFVYWNTTLLTLLLNKCSRGPFFVRLTVRSSFNEPLPQWQFED